MSALLSAVCQAFDQSGWKYREVHDRGVVEADFEAHHTKLRLHAQAFPEINAVSVVAQTAFAVPASRAGIVAELLMRINETLTVGNFEMQWDAGRVLFRATNIFPEHGVDPKIIAGLVHSAVAEVDRITPFVSIVLKMNAGELGKLNMSMFLMREDLLPDIREKVDGT